MKRFIKSLFRRIRRLGRKPDLLTRIMDRCYDDAPVSDFARNLFKDETSETINARFARAMEEADRLYGPGRR